MRNPNRTYNDFFWEVPAAQFPTDFKWELLRRKVCEKVESANPVGQCVASIDREGSTALLLARSTVPHPEQEWLGSVSAALRAMGTSIEDWGTHGEDMLRRLYDGPDEQ